MRITAGDKPKGLAYPLEKVKSYLRVTGTDQDDVISTIISSAVGRIERETWIVLQSRTYTGNCDNWSSQNNLDKYPVTAVTSVKYYDVDNALQTLDTSKYWTDFNGNISRVNIDDMPTLYADRYTKVQINFTAGYADWHDIPEDYVHLLLNVVADMYDNRGSVIMGSVTENPAVSDLMNNYSKKEFR